MITNSADLRDAIQEIGKHDHDLGVVVEKILVNLSDAEAHVVAQVTLRDYVRHVLTTPASAPVSSEVAQYSTASGQVTPSASTAALIDWYAAELSALKHVGDRFIPLGQCTLKDVRYLSSSRRQKAADLIAEAKRYERLAEAMRQGDAETVAELDPAVGREVLKK